MSLISDGLKKAHLDALRQDREQRRHFLSPGRVDVPSGGSNFLAIAVAAVGSAVIAAVIAIYFVRSSPSAASASAAAPTQTAVAVNSTPALPVTAPPVTAPPVVAEPQVRVASAALPERTADTLKPRTYAARVQERDVAPPPAAPKRVKAPKAVETLVSESAPAPAAPEVPPVRRSARRDRFVDGESYASPINAPGGVEVTLSGISSARGESVAIMNGNIIRAGATIGPFTVEKIERGRVQLRYIDVRFWMTY